MNAHINYDLPQALLAVITDEQFDDAALLAQLEELSAAKVAALQAPGRVLLKLAATGFGVRLPG